MDPKIFGRGTWFFIFKLIYFFIHNMHKEIDIFFKIKDLMITPNSDPELIENVKKKYPEYIKNIDNNNYIEVIKKNNLEMLKKKISILVSSLPCNECKIHTNECLNVNNIYETDSIYIILHFFIELRNKFYDLKIDRLALKDVSSIIKNEKFLLKQILLE